MTDAPPLLWVTVSTPAALHATETVSVAAIPVRVPVDPSVLVMPICPNQVPEQSS